MSTAQLFWEELMFWRLSTLKCFLSPKSIWKKLFFHAGGYASNSMVMLWICRHDFEVHALKLTANTIEYQMAGRWFISFWGKNDWKAYFSGVNSLAVSWIRIHLFSVVNQSLSPFQSLSVPSHTRVAVGSSTSNQRHNDPSDKGINLYIRWKSLGFLREG